MISKKKKLNTLVIFTEQFASMTRASIPLFKTLDNLQKDILDIEFSKTLKDITKEVEKGIALDEALPTHKEWFDSVYVNMVKAGMKSGKLDITLTQLSKFLKKSFQINNKVYSALSYPTFLIIMTIVLIIFMIIYILPMFKSFFENSGKELPHLTQILLNSSDFLRENGFILIISMLMLISVFTSFLATDIGKKLFDKFKLNFFIFGILNKKISISKFIRTFGVLIQADIPILDSIKISKNSTNNIIIEEEIEEIINLIEKGYTIANAFREVNIFPELIIQMVNSGEESGNLDELLIATADYYDNQIENELDSIVAIINPIMLLFLGLFIAILMIGIYKPIFQSGNVF